MLSQCKNLFYWNTIYLFYFTSAKFYNQSICCPSFKHPATILRPWENDLRRTRLSSGYLHKIPSLSSSKIAIPSRHSSSTIKSHSTETANPTASGLTLVENKSKPVGIDESSVESQFAYNRDGPQESISSQNSMLGNISILGSEYDSTSEDEIEEDHIRLAVDSEIVRKNSTLLSKASNVEDTDHNEDDSFLMEERRGNRDKESISSSGVKKPPSDAFLSVPAPNLAPNNKCRHQVYGMPRGHWPWMVVDSSKIEHTIFTSRLIVYHTLYFFK